MNVVINTPSGRVGSAVASLLLDNNVNLTVISRNPDSVDRLVSRGATLVRGSFDERDTLDEAMRRNDTLFWVTPTTMRPDFHRWAIDSAELAASVARENHLVKIINLSCMGAHCGTQTGPISPLKDIETIFQGACNTSISIRPGLFMENLLQHLSTIQTSRTIELPVYAEVTMPMVAVKDVAAAVQNNMLDAGIEGHHIIGLQGPETLNYVSVAQALTKELGRPVHYRELTMDQYRKTMIQNGTPDFHVDMINQMYAAINDGRLLPLERRSRKAPAATSLGSFIRTVLKPALGRAAVGG